MADIFLSYKREDRPRAEIIAKALENQGFTVWWDRVIPPGRRFDEVIEEELEAAHCIVVLWSKESIQSKWIKTEASEGDKRGILIPVLIDDVQPPLAFRMVQAAKLIDWDGTPNPEFNLLLGSIARICGRHVPAKSDRITTSEKEFEELDTLKYENNGIVIEKNALKAIKAGYNLLPVGILSTVGRFDSGSSIKIFNESGREVAKGTTMYSSNEIERIKGQHSSEIQEILGIYQGDAVVPNHKIIFIDQ